VVKVRIWNSQYFCPDIFDVPNVKRPAMKCVYHHIVRNNDFNTICRTVLIASINNDNLWQDES
jgi:hypothetical protein